MGVQDVREEEVTGDPDGEGTEEGFRDVREEGAGVSETSRRGGVTPSILRPLSKIVTGPPPNLESQRGRSHDLR